MVPVENSSFCICNTWPFLELKVWRTTVVVVHESAAPKPENIDAAAGCGVGRTIAWCPNIRSGGIENGIENAVSDSGIHTPLCPLFLRSYIDTPALKQ